MTPNRCGESFLAGRPSLEPAIALEHSVHDFLEADGRKKALNRGKMLSSSWLLRRS
jgi:hypothetical protein